MGQRLVIVDQEAAGSRKQSRAISQVNGLNLEHVAEDLGKDRVRDELHSAEGQHLDVRCHATHLIQHVLLEPVVVLEVEAEGLLRQILP